MKTTTKKRGPGRPKLGHTKVVEVAFSPDAYRLVREAAKKDGVSLREWLRSAAYLKLAGVSP